MFSQRSYQKEMIDDFSIDDKRIDKALAELTVINKYLGGRSTTKKGLNKILFAIKSTTPVKILDVGSGASDILSSIKEHDIQITSFDLNKRTAFYLNKHSVEINIICADVFKLPFKENIFDISHLSLFLHHFKDYEIAEIIKRLSLVSRKGIIINDLHRSIFAYAGIKILTKLFSKSELVKNDGPLSVKRGFKKSELKNILNELNLKYEIKHKWAFRWLVVIYLNEE